MAFLKKVWRQLSHLCHRVYIYLYICVLFESLAKYLHARVFKGRKILRKIWPILCVVLAAAAAESHLVTCRESLPIAMNTRRTSVSLSFTQVRVVRACYHHKYTKSSEPSKICIQGDAVGTWCGCFNSLTNADFLNEIFFSQRAECEQKGALCTREFDFFFLNTFLFIFVRVR